MILIMFDMDGTLIDTGGLIAEHMASAFRDAGLPPPTPADVRGIIGLALPVAIGTLAGTDDIEVIEGLVGAYKAHYQASLKGPLDREPLYPGARAALDRLKAREDVILGIATGKGLSGVTRILGKHGITDHFLTVQTPDHNPSKPHPGMLLTAMADTGVSAGQCVMIGDTTFDMELARAAGAHAIGVTWGYHAPDDLLKAGAEVLISSYEELDAAIEKVIQS